MSQIAALSMCADRWCTGSQIKAPKKTLSNKEKKKKDRLRAARKKAGEVVSDSEEEDF